MFKLESNLVKDKKILDTFNKWDKKIEKNRMRIIVIYFGLLFFAFFGKNVFGDWFSEFSDLLKILVVVFGYIAFNYNKIKKDNKNKEEDILKENNFEKRIKDSMVKNSVDTLFEYESNKNDILKNSIGDINNSSEEWKIKIYLLIFLGIILFVYFNFYK